MKYKPKGYWRNYRCIEDARKYKTKSEWKKNSGSAYKIAYDNGWLDECCEHMITTRKPKSYWTKRRCIEDAKKYEKRSEWQKKSTSAYHKALKKNWLDECCSHMPNASKKNYWTKDHCIEDAKKYNRRIDWQKKSKGAYKSAWKNKWLDECCGHMIKRKFLTHECTL